jgi:FxsC-like protein
VPLLDDIASAFGSPQLAPAVPASLAQPARPAGSGFRRHVHFIFAALDPQALGEGRDPSPYHDLGGPDWKPFYPELQRRIGALAAHIVSDSDLDFDSDHIELTSDLAGAVRAALKEGKPVVVFVDRWSLYASADYQDIFREFDGQNFNNCAVLLPWNPGDPELAGSRDNIDQVIADVLHFRRQYAPSSPYFCKDVDSLESLSLTLHAVLNQIQAEMRRNAPLRRPLPLPIARPTISGPGA